MSGHHSETLYVHASSTTIDSSATAPVALGWARQYVAPQGSRRLPQWSLGITRRRRTCQPAGAAGRVAAAVTRRIGRLAAAIPAQASSRKKYSQSQ
jgi:hypothetical protein